MDKSNRQRYPLPSRNPQSFADRPKSYRRTTYYEDLVRAQKQANKANDKKAHFKKWWWAYFSGLIVLILIIILPMSVHDPRISHLALQTVSLQEPVSWLQYQRLPKSSLMKP